MTEAARLDLPAHIITRRRRKPSSNPRDLSRSRRLDRYHKLLRSVIVPKTGEARMRRRDFVAVAGAAVLVGWPALAETSKVVGVLAPGPLRPIASFKRRLSELGWVEG